eukprot:m.89391 g.89391  ORF g.89391 m.89391 type:complete len:257 (-) comp13215_c0_seq1:144-914(-)
MSGLRLVSAGLHHGKRRCLHMWKTPEATRLPVTGRLIKLSRSPVFNISARHAATKTPGPGFVARHPFASQVLIATLKTSAADLVVQMVVEKTDWKEIDWRRNLLYSCFGFLYLGVVQWHIYVRGFSRLFPRAGDFCNKTFREKLKDKQGLRDLFGQIFVDLCFVQAVLYWPTFYMFKNGILLGGFSEEKPYYGVTETCVVAASKYRDTFWADNLGMSAFWFPADILVMSVPLHYRLPVNHTISFLWCCILSFWRTQ